MSSLAFSLFLTLTLATKPALSQENGFTDMQCLKTSFSATVTHKGQPFGLTDNILKVEKEGCVLRVMHQKMKILSEKWVVDVCRAPVHIKKGSGAVEVLRREKGCLKDPDTEYCRNVRLLGRTLQDDGLIFAKGAKEDLNSNHGKVFCSYLLSKAYLDRGLVFSLNGTYKNILDRTGGLTHAQVAPEKREKVEAKKLPVPEEEESVSSNSHDKVSSEEGKGSEKSGQEESAEEAKTSSKNKTSKNEKSTSSTEEAPSKEEDLVDF